MRKLIVLVSFVGSLLPLTTRAQSMGVYCWKLNPFTDVLCFDIESKGFVFELTGTERGPTYEFPLHGAANSDHSSNKILFGFTFHFPTFHGQTFASIDATTLDGTWRDNFGFSGNFTFLGTGPLNLETTASKATDNNYLSHITSQ